MIAMFLLGALIAILSPALGAKLAGLFIFIVALSGMINNVFKRIKLDQRKSDYWS